MARSILGRAVCFTAAYRVDRLMLDTGCSQIALRFIEGSATNH
jgi:hypothetical protein